MQLAQQQRGALFARGAAARGNAARPAARAAAAVVVRAARSDPFVLEPFRERRALKAS